MPGRTEFQFSLPKSVSTPIRRDPNAPLRILVMADLSGRSQREPSTALVDLASRPLLTVNADNLNVVMARLAPKLRLPPSSETSGMSIAINFARLDDFHPDALYQRLEIFQVLRRARARLLNPASFAQAVAELSPTPTPESIQPEPTSPAENDTALIERLLGRTPACWDGHPPPPPYGRSIRERRPSTPC